MEYDLSKIENFIENNNNPEHLKYILSQSCEKLSEISPEQSEEQLLLICNFVTPNNVRVLSKLANLYYKKNDLAKSLSLAKKAVFLTQEKDVNSLMNAAIIASDADQRDYAKQKYNQVLTIDPTNARAKFGLAIESFKDKDYKNGWSLYLNRHSAFDTARNEPSKIKNLPRWDGESEGEIYFYNEQGYGDLIFSIRFWHNLEKIKNKFSMIFDKNISSLIKMTKFSKFVGRQLKNPKFKCSVLDLPALFADQDYREDYYKSIFDQHKPKNRKKPKIGITFCGGSTYAADSRRSIHLCFLKQLIKNKNYNFCIFQKDYKDSKFFDFSCSTKEYPIKLDNFSTTASCLLDLDALISIDSSVAHLSGALGVPTFVLLEKVPDFRWYPYTKKIPWYNSWIPARQASRCDWSKAVGNLENKLEKYFIQHLDRHT